MIARTALAALTALTLTAAPTLAQTAAELVTVATISSKLDSSIAVPAGTSFVSNPKFAQEFAAQLGADATNYTDFELYVAKGLAKNLADAFVVKLETNFAAAGYYKSGSSAQTLNGETRIRSEFANDSGKTLLLYVVKRADGVYFLSAKKK